MCFGVTRRCVKKVLASNRKHARFLCFRCFKTAFQLAKPEQGKQPAGKKHSGTVAVACWQTLPGRGRHVVPRCGSGVLHNIQQQQQAGRRKRFTFEQKEK